MEQEKKWPRVGDKLVHQFRKKPGQIEAEVISVDRGSGLIALRIADRVFPSLSSAAEACSGAAANGWIYWGLKKQSPRSSGAASGLDRPKKRSR